MTPHVSPSPDPARLPRASLLLAALVVALTIPALLPGGSEALKRERVKALLAAELEQRGLSVKSVSVCQPRRRFSLYVCTWRAEGAWPGEVPYRCTGQARYLVDERRWQIERCRNLLAPRIPLKARPGPHPAFGYNESWLGLGSESFSLLGASSADVARQNLTWSTIERSRGDYDWAHVDRLYNDLLAEGVRPSWVLISAPCWAQRRPARCRQGKSRLHPSARHLDEFARFAAAVARRYPLAIGIEVWNEPNFSRFWGGKPDPRAYSRMLKLAAEAIHDANERMPVVSAGLSPHARTKPRRSIAFTRFLTEIYKRGAAKRADAIGTHPLPSVGPGGDYLDRVRTQLGLIRQVMGRSGDRRTPIWVTETGLSTAGPEAYDPGQQAQALVEIYTMLRRVRNLPVVILHRFRDDPAAGAGTKDSGFGVVTGTGERKPAFCALAAARGAGC